MSENKGDSRNRKRQRPGSPRQSRGWKIHVRNLGRIEEATIELAPLTLFLGKNNTGKSYLATVMWAIGNLESLLRREFAVAARPKWVKSFFENVGDKPRNLTITHDHLQETVEYINRVLEHEASAWLAYLFAFDGFPQAKLWIEPSQEQLPEVKVSLTKDDNKETFTVSVSAESFLLRSAMPVVLLKDHGSAHLLNTLIRLAAFGERPPKGNYIYIPAARTGLMLAFPAYMSEVIERFSTEAASGPSLKLNRANLEFLQYLVFSQSNHGDNASSRLANWLERQILHGEIVVKRDQGLPSFSYKADGTQQDFPLHATSSMVTELAPFLITLRRRGIIGTLVFEEPEAHLHLSAQRVMAQALVRLVNLGTSVLLTSHSDTFVQELNNLIQMKGSNEKERLIAQFGYASEDLLDLTQVMGYEFVDSGSKTEVVPLKLTAQGFVVPSLLSALRSLASETIAIQKADETTDD